MKLFITGGCGSIGEALIKHYSSEDNQITVYSRDEYKHALIKSKYPNVISKLGDVRDFETLKDAMSDSDTVIHAAALKRIEVCERSPVEATKTNILGTYNVVRAAQELDIKKLVSLSTDKAVEPINIYGMTKHVQEKIVIDAGYCCTRYGNIFGSRGSVVEIFDKLSMNNQKLTVTDPNMTRFILDYNHAITLIDDALHVFGGVIVVAKSYAATIGDIARAFSDNIIYTGCQLIEKKHETLLSEAETANIMFENSYSFHLGSLNYSDKTCAYTSENTTRLTIDEIRTYIGNWRRTK